jgi:O-antigen ligase
LQFTPAALQKLYPQLGARDYLLRLYLYFALGIVISNGIYYFISPGSSNSYFSGTSFYTGRFRGWFINPNDLASTLSVLCAPVLWYFIERQKSLLAKFGLGFVLLSMMVEVFATQSRAGLLAAAVSLGILFLGRKKWLPRVLIIVLLVFVVSGIYFESPHDNIFRHFIYRNEESLQGSGRLFAWSAALNRFMTRPLFGSGLGISNPSGGVSGIVFSLRTYALQVANSYLSILEELGIIGFTLFILALFIPVLRRCWIEFNSFETPIDQSKLVFISSVCAGFFNVIFEGWLFSVGTLFCISLWTFASLILEKDKVKMAKVYQ